MNAQAENKAPTSFTILLASLMTGAKMSSSPRAFIWNLLEDCGFESGPDVRGASPFGLS